MHRNWTERTQFTMWPFLLQYPWKSRNKTGSGACQTNLWDVVNAPQATVTKIPGHAKVTSARWRRQTPKSKLKRCFVEKKCKLNCDHRPVKSSNNIAYGLTSSEQDGGRRDIVGEETCFSFGAVKRTPVLLKQHSKQSLGGWGWQFNSAGFGIKSLILAEGNYALLRLANA